MFKIKIFNLIDKIFISSAIFLIIYAWINFFIRNLWSTFFLSLIFSSAIIFVLFYLINNKNEKLTFKKQHLAEIEKNFLAFRLLNKNEQLKLIKSIIEKNYICETVKESLTYKSNDKNIQIFIVTHIEKLTQFELINLVSNRKKQADVLMIICSEFDSNINTKILLDLEINLVNKTILYEKFFLPNNIYPNTENLNSKNEKKNFKKILKNFFLPHKAKSYFLCGLVLLFSSIILPYHNYYLIFGSVLLIISIICKFQKIIYP